MKYILYVLFLMPLICNAMDKKEILYSPDNRLSVSFICSQGGMYWSVEKNSEKIIMPSHLGLSFLNAPEFSKDMEISNVVRKTIDSVWKDNFGKDYNVKDKANEMYIELKENKFPGRTFGICFRVYNEGVAFRYHIPEKTALLCRTIIGEKTEFKFNDNINVWCPIYPSYNTGQEMEFNNYTLDMLSQSDIIGLPLLAKISDDSYALISEANIRDWCGMYLGKKNDSNTLKIKLPPLMKGGELNEVGESPRGHKVKLKGESYSPWRFVMLADNPGKMHEFSIVKNLNDKCKLENVSWIKPGICVWDNWWSNNARMNTESIKHFIDFASENGFPYQLIDWRWYGTYNSPKADITKPANDIDMPLLLEYAKSKNVKLWLWVHYNDFVRQPDALSVYEKWGIAGVKIDFMNSDNQTMVEWYEQTLKLAAKHHIMINFHGAYKPDGLSRTYPNLLTREGVLGNEYNKNSCRATPDHNVMLAYTRAIVGEMDYTPGGFINKPIGEFSITTPTQVQGTRNHQLALFNVYESPLTTLCDAPSNYYNQSGFDFIKEIPTVWKKTVFVSGNVGEYICLARESHDGRWFISAINNSVKRDVTINLDFLPDAAYSAVAYYDDEDDYSNVIKKNIKKLSKSDCLDVTMASGGGFNIILTVK